MPTDKVNKFQSGLPGLSPIHSFDERKSVVAGKKQNHVLPLDHPKHGLNAMEYTDNGDGSGVGEAENHPESAKLIAAEAASEPQDGVTSEIKTRVENRLSRIKSEAAESENNLMEISNFESGPTLKEGETRAASPADPSGTTPGYNLKNVTAELERRRAELFALARGAEARARESEEKYKHAETKLEQESAQRLLLEQRLRELEEEYLKRVSATETEELKRHEAEMARDEAEARLRETINRVKEAEARLKEENEVRAQAEKAFMESEARAQAAALGHAEAEQRRAEADQRALAAEDNAREIEGLIEEAEAIAHAATDRYKASEARLENEVELRLLAEQKLKALEEELSYYLEVDWAKIEPEMAPPNSPPVSALAEEATWRLQTQIEDEQKARITAEKARAAAEAKLVELETELRRADEKHRQAEAGLKKILRKQESELRTLSEKAARTNFPATEFNLSKPTEDADRRNYNEQLAKRTKIKLVTYGAMITLLLVVLVLLALQAIQQL